MTQELKSMEESVISIGKSIKQLKSDIAQIKEVLLRCTKLEDSSGGTEV
jgi:hypothetical protein